MGGVTLDGRVVLLLIVASLMAAFAFGEPFSDWGEIDDLRQHVAAAR